MKLIKAIKRIYKIAFCEHTNKVRVISMNGGLDYKACRDCGLTIFEK